MIPIIAFLSHFYTLSFKDIMDLNIRTTFALYNQGVKNEAKHYRELLRISAVPMMQIEYYEKIRKHYDFVIDPNAEKLPKPRGPVIESGSQEARHLLQTIMTNFKISQGYGRKQRN